MKYSANKAVWFAAIVAGISAASYIGWFWAVQQLPLSTSTSDWGQFGSYMAGTAGVSFALATVWMLAETLRLQRVELRHTREELKRSSDALEKQVNLSMKSSEAEKHFYIVKTIDENIESICCQHIDHNDNQIRVGGMPFSFTHFELGQEQLELIASQYMHLMYVADQARTTNSSSTILDIAQPMIYKYKKMLFMLYDAGYFDRYNSRVRQLGFAQIMLDNLEYEIDLDAPKK